MHRCIPAGDLDRSGNQFMGNWPHGHHQGGGKRTSRFTAPAGNVHGHVLSFLDISNGDTGADQGPFEAETASEQKRNHVGIENSRNIRLFHKRATIFPDSVQGNVCSDIGLIRHTIGHKHTGFQNFQDRAWFGIPDAEKQKIECIPAIQNNQIGLSIGLGKPGCRAGPDAITNILANFSGTVHHVSIFGIDIQRLPPVPWLSRD